MTQAVAPTGWHPEPTVAPTGWHPDQAVVPAGWYADPELPRTLRWWDGAVWTAHIQRTTPASTNRKLT